MGHDYGERLRRAGEAAGDAGIDALVITPSADLRYLIGYDPPLLERLTALLVRPDADPLLIVPELEAPRASDAPAGSLVEFRSWKDGEDPYGSVADVLGGVSALAVEEAMPAAHLLRIQRELPGASCRLASAVMSSLRVRKDGAEIEALAKAGRADDEAFRRIARDTLNGRTEEDIAQSLRVHIVEAGHDEPLFWIVGSGPNGASPHHEPGTRMLRRGESVVLDFGGRAGGYCSDMTRTVAIGEPEDHEVREVHAVVAEAQEAAFRTVRPGLPAEEVDRAARSVIEDAGYGHAFIHRTGHGIGLDAHEDPYIVEGNATPLEPAMSFSIEPGIYLAGRFGVRIEDIVLVTADGAQRLNHAPRELAILS
jgi:Xaa-Pro aminopeptidase